MEKLKSLISIIGSIGFLLAGLLLFSCQDNTRVEEKTVVKGDTTITITKEVNRDSSNTTVSDINWREESSNFKDRLQVLGEEARKKGGKVGQKINERVEKLELERKNYQGDTTKSDFKERWKAFRDKTNDEIDSLNNKVKN